MKQRCRDLQQKLIGFIKENKLFMLFLLFMTGYYLFRMFGTDVLYDEIFTYRSYINRGLIYCVIDWRFPNNHILYSILSCLFAMSGNPYIALRGLAFCVSVANILLLYTLVKKVFPKNIALFVTMLYTSFYMVVYQSLQGRGYILSICILLLALHMLVAICGGNAKKRHYLSYAICLILALYTVPSNLYFILILSITGGLCLLLLKKYQILIKLIITSVCGAVGTFFIYIPTFIGMGLMRLMRVERGLTDSDAISGFGIKGAIETFVQNPISSIVTGIQEMTGNSFVEPIARSEVMAGYAEWVKELLSGYFGSSMLIIIAIVIGLIFVTIRIVCGFEKNNSADTIGSANKADNANKADSADNEKKLQMNRLLAMLFLVSFCFILLVPFLQSVLPPVRTLVFLAVPFSIACGYALLFIKNHIGKLTKPVGIALTVVFIVYLGYSFFGTKALQICAENEAQTYQAIVETKAWEYDTYLYGPIFAREQLIFHYGKELEEETEKPDYVILLKEQTEKTCMKEPYQAKMVYADIPWEWIDNYMKQVYDDGEVVVYVKE